jgi:amphi-Trp domain-containing protein
MQDRESLVRYLGALIDGLQHGRLLLASNGERLEMKTPPFVKFDLQAKNKRNRSQIVLKISWKNSTDKPELKVEPLQIETEGPGGHRSARSGESK